MKWFLTSGLSMLVRFGLLVSMLLLPVALWAAPLVIAHRGASGYLPEHTMEAKALAFAQGADYLEQDVVMTSDDELVVFHDLTLERMTDVASRFPERKRIDGSFYVIDFTLAELQTLNVHEGTVIREGKLQAQFPQRFPADKAMFRIHTLAAELDFIDGLQASTGRQTGIYPELKSPWFHHRNGKDISLAVLLMLKARGYGKPDSNLYLQSFDYPELVRVKHQLLPAMGMDLKLVQLIADNAWLETMVMDEQGQWQPYDFNWMLTTEGLQKLAETVVGVGPSLDMLVPALTNPEQLPETLPWVNAAHSMDLEVHPYTFRREREQLPSYVQTLEELINLYVNRYKVDGVFTDFPDIAVKVLHPAG